MSSNCWQLAVCLCLSAFINQNALCVFDEGTKPVRSVGEFSADRINASQKVSIGNYFVSEIVICRAELFTSAGQSPISSVKPSCGCVSSKLSEPNKTNGKIKRELLFTVRGVAPGVFRSKIEVMREDGTTFDLLLQGDVIPVIEFIPRVIDLSESADSRLIEVRSSDNKIDMEDAHISIGDDRFVLSSFVKTTRCVQFQLGLSPEYRLAQLLSQREILFRIQVNERQFSIGLPIKHKSKEILVPSTLTADKNDRKPKHVFLIGSKADLKQTTGRARIPGDTAGDDPIAIGSFQRRTENSGVFELGATG